MEADEYEQIFMAEVVDDGFYSRKKIETDLEEDEISAEDAAFMQGYLTGE